VAEPNAVGVIGWSFTGHHVLRLLTQYPKLVAAATVADSASLGYFPHMLAVNYFRDVRVATDKLTGGPPNLEHPGSWMERNPVYKLPMVTTPLRLEAIGPGSLLNMWETYALLRYAKRPVDYIYYPTGTHGLEMPVDRLISQGGNLDWFRYWLQGYADPSERKAVQYARWRNLGNRARVER
jgi:dipeptidyl aminopeptidase/acylaminoacyl peptidase